MSVEEYREWVERANAQAAKPRQRKPRQLEHDIQCACVRWMAEEHPEYEPYFWATPNGGYRAKATARAMKAEGMKAGVPDLQLAYPAQGYHGLFIEMKKSEAGKNGKLVKKGTTSKAQRRRMDALSKAGYKCCLCYSFEQFKNIIREYLSVR